MILPFLARVEEALLQMSKFEMHVAERRVLQVPVLSALYRMVGDSDLPHCRRDPST